MRRAHCLEPPASISHLHPLLLHCCCPDHLGWTRALFLSGAFFLSFLIRHSIRGLVGLVTVGGRGTVLLLGTDVFPVLKLCMAHSRCSVNTCELTKSMMSEENVKLNSKPRPVSLHRLPLYGGLLCSYFHMPRSPKGPPQRCGCGLLSSLSPFLLGTCSYRPAFLLLYSCLSPSWKDAGKHPKSSSWHCPGLISRPQDPSPIGPEPPEDL